MMTNLEIAMHQKKVKRSEVPLKKRPKEGANKKSSTSKSRKKAEPSASITVDYIFLIALKSILSSVVQHIPKEILKKSS